MIIDDEAVNVAVLERLVGPLGLAAVHGFTDPHQAILHCTRALPDLVLLDLHMPGLDGFAVMEALRHLVPDDGFLPVLVLTADVTSQTKERVLAAGADDFLTKPFDRTEALLRVTNLLDTCALHRRIREHNATLQADLDARLSAEHDAAAATRRQNERIDQALTPGALTVLFQPVTDLTSGQIVGAEALARFSCAPQPPNDWFTEAAAVGRGEELELAAIAAALEQIDQLPPDVFLALNTSPTTATSRQLDELLSRHPAGRIVLELTEHTPVGDYDALLATLDRYRRRGIRIAVDDTGAGYAGLQHLLRIRPDILKLDTALTRGIHTDPVRRSLAAALVTFAAEIGATITAEGIEEADELHTLMSLDIPWGQGYHLARPAPLPLPTGPLTAITTASFPAHLAPTPFSSPYVATSETQVNTNQTGPNHAHDGEPSPGAPESHAAPLAEPSAAEHGPHDSSTPPTVLYIEDDPGNAALARAILAARHDMRLLVAPDGTTGLQLAREHQPCLVLLDLHLPDMTGQQLLTDLRHDPRTNHIPIVIMSADPTAAQIPHADGVLPKPYQITQLIELVDQAVTTKPL